jgi:hypothetical protein
LPVRAPVRAEPGIEGFAGRRREVTVHIEAPDGDRRVAGVLDYLPLRTRVQDRCIRAVPLQQQCRSMTETGLPDAGLPNSRRLLQARCFLFAAKAPDRQFHNASASDPIAAASPNAGVGWVWAMPGKTALTRQTRVRKNRPGGLTCHPHCEFHRYTDEH